MTEEALRRQKLVSSFIQIGKERHSSSSEVEQETQTIKVRSLSGNIHHGANYIQIKENDVVKTFDYQESPSVDSQDDLLKGVQPCVTVKTSAAELTRKVQKGITKQQEVVTAGKQIAINKDTASVIQYQSKEIIQRDSATCINKTMEMQHQSEHRGSMTGLGTINIAAGDTATIPVNGTDTMI